MCLSFQLTAQVACRYAVLTRRLAPPRLGGTPLALGPLSICPRRGPRTLRHLGHGPRYLYVRLLVREISLYIRRFNDSDGWLRNILWLDDD